MLSMSFNDRARDFFSKKRSFSLFAIPALLMVYFSIESYSPSEPSNQVTTINMEASLPARVVNEAVISHVRAMGLIPEGATQVQSVIRVDRRVSVRGGPYVAGLLAKVTFRVGEQSFSHTMPYDGLQQVVMKVIRDTRGDQANLTPIAFSHEFDNNDRDTASVILVRYRLLLEKPAG